MANYTDTTFPTGELETLEKVLENIQVKINEENKNPKVTTENIYSMESVAFRLFNVSYVDETTRIERENERKECLECMGRSQTSTGKCRVSLGGS